MMRLFCLMIIPVLLLLSAAGPARAQQAIEQVLYLKNGWVLRGRLLSPPAADPVRLATADRNEFVFRRAEIDSLRERPAPPARVLGVAYKARGFGHFTELGALAGRNTSRSVNTSAFSFQTVNGYKFGQWVFVGLGMGADLYATQSLVPLFASVHGDFTRRGTLLPFYSLDVGYGINITGRDNAPAQPVTYRGGTLWAAGAVCWATATPASSSAWPTAPSAPPSSAKAWFRSGWCSSALPCGPASRSDDCAGRGRGSAHLAEKLVGTGLPGTAAAPGQFRKNLPPCNFGPNLNAFPCAKRYSSPCCWRWPRPPHLPKLPPRLRQPNPRSTSTAC